MNTSWLCLYHFLLIIWSLLKYIFGQKKKHKKLNCYTDYKLFYRLKQLLVFYTCRYGISFKIIYRIGKLVKDQTIAHGLKPNYLRLSLDTHFKIFSKPVNSTFSTNVYLLWVYISKLKGAREASITGSSDGCW